MAFMVFELFILITRSAVEPLRRWYIGHFGMEVVAIVCRTESVLEYCTGYGDREEKYYADDRS